MSRPLHIEFPGAVCHVSSRGDRRDPIHRDDENRSMKFRIMARAMDRFDAQVLANCQMGIRRGGGLIFPDDHLCRPETRMDGRSKACMRGEARPMRPPDRQHA